MIGNTANGTMTNSKEHLLTKQSKETPDAINQEALIEDNIPKQRTHTSCARRRRHNFKQ